MDNRTRLGQEPLDRLAVSARTVKIIAKECLRLRADLQVGQLPVFAEFELAAVSGGFDSVFGDDGGVGPFLALVIEREDRARDAISGLGGQDGLGRGLVENAVVVGEVVGGTGRETTPAIFSEELEAQPVGFREGSDKAFGSGGFDRRRGSHDEIADFKGSRPDLGWHWRVGGGEVEFELLIGSSVGEELQGNLSKPPRWGIGNLQRRGFFAGHRVFAGDGLGPIAAGGCVVELEAVSLQEQVSARKSGRGLGMDREGRKEGGESQKGESGGGYVRVILIIINRFNDICCVLAHSRTQSSERPDFTLSPNVLDLAVLPQVAWPLAGVSPAFPETAPRR